MANKNGLNIAQKVYLELLWILCRGFALLPHCIRHYIFGNICYFLLCYVTHYRNKVIMDNLRRSFPDKSEQELREICRDTYKNLAEQIINTISQSGVSDKTLQHRMKLIDAEKIREEIGDRTCQLSAFRRSSFQCEAFAARFRWRTPSA